MSNLADDELILRLLSRCLPMREAAVATQALWDRYASYGNAISAPFLELLDVPSLGRPGATLLKCIHSAAIRLAAVPIRDAPLLKNLTNLYNYLNVSMARDRTEVYRVLFLDTKNYLIADEVLAEGVENWVHVSIKETARRCLQHHASAIILVHNHPSGDPTPSESDLSMTKKIQIAMEMLGIFVHDHIIIGQGTICSMRELNFFEIY